MIVFYITLAALFSVTLFMTYKYIKLKAGIKKYDEIGTGRYGFYKYIYSSYHAIVYVDEIDRYKDGYSKIKFNHAEPTGSWKKDSVEAAQNNFITLIETKNVEWLESEEDIKKIRKEKLENLKKL